MKLRSKNYFGPKRAAQLRGFIRQLVKSEFESQAAFCRELELNANAVSRFLNGSADFGWTLARQLAEYTGIPVERIVGDDEGLEVRDLPLPQ